jgi:hypothetical protein
MKNKLDRVNDQILSEIIDDGKISLTKLAEITDMFNFFPLKVK